AAPPAPPTALPPGPPRQEQRKSSPRAEPRPAPKPAPRPVPRQAYAEVATPQAPVDTAAARQQSTEPAHPSADAAEAGENAQADAALSTAPPSVQAPSASRYAASQPSSGAASQAAATWEAQLLGHLERFKRYPRAAQRRRLEGVVLVRFAVDRQGRVLRVGIARASGHAPLDDEAVATVHRAAPLPPPPADIPGDPVEVTTPVDFFLRGR
ncbi:energy transducer TonB, partial [Thauera linaloolentis]